MKSILCIHQGYELYGSDRSFALSVKTLKDKYPNAIIDVMIPKDGPIRHILESSCSSLIINKDLAILRKTELKKNPFSFLYKIATGIIKAINKSKQYDLLYVNTIVVLDYIIAARFIDSISVLHIREIPMGFQEKIFSRIISFSKMNLIFNSLNTKNSFSISNNLNKKVLLNGIKGFSNNEKIPKNNK